MTMTQSERKQVMRAMVLAARKGFDPRNSHATQARKWVECERMRAIRRPG